MRTVYKYPLTLARSDQWDVATQVIEAPADARVVQAEMIDVYRWVVWMEVDTDKPNATHTFQVFPTGVPIPNDAGWHIKTGFEGPYVWHLFHAFH